MEHFYLIGGHGDGDPGACSNGYKEYDLARKFNDILAKYLKENGAKVSIYNKERDMYKQTAKGQGLHVFNVDKRIVIETHLNASSNKSAKGCETLIASGLSADKFDEAIQKTLTKYFDNRGIKKRSDLLNMNVAKQRGINYRLVELCFISNKDDVNRLVKNMDAIAKSMADALVKNNSIGKTNSKVEYPSINGEISFKKKREYIVKVKEGVCVRKKPNINSEVYRIRYPEESKKAPIKTYSYIDQNGYRWLSYISVDSNKYWIAEAELKYAKGGRSKYEKYFLLADITK